MKKSIVMMLFLVLGMVVLTGCGSKIDKTAEEFKNKIIKEESYDDLNKEENFSFLIYKDKNASRYISEAFVPADNTSSAVKYFYYYDESQKLHKNESESDFNDKKSSGNYEVIYKSGKFK
ncbi:hypothetical protein LIT97_14915 (plasmid) [Enterococcus faecalis]|uniref:hypothetical protein n=1 Tax=Enterococcus faecalis TaxID=1351 RepID=UPI001D0A5CF1|nr:hypothetical protein [Enterococcus faecalis]UDM48393.1 hypothetical protein LIT97_14915 [Enterococcus faecalis]